VCDAAVVLVAAALSAVVGVGVVFSVAFAGAGLAVYVFGVTGRVATVVGVTFGAGAGAPSGDR
jgi:hypothetical protein